MMWCLVLLEALGTRIEYSVIVGCGDAPLVDDDGI